MLERGNNLSHISPFLLKTLLIILFHFISLCLPGWFRRHLMRSSLFFDSIITDHNSFSPETLTAQWEIFWRQTEICFKVCSGDP